MDMVRMVTGLSCSFVGSFWQPHAVMSLAVVMSRRLLWIFSVGFTVTVVGLWWGRWLEQGLEASPLKSQEEQTSEQEGSVQDSGDDELNA
ncbi:MAG: hypothetical protein KTR25_19630 [Myxococcales bacterium]|nr:hypothetical protein [Myxococcales bacterium]